MQPNNNTVFSLHIKDAYNKLGLHRSWSRSCRENMTVKFNLMRFDYGDSRIFPFSLLRKDFYEGL